MPSNKDFKRLVRWRMHKTGESYTTARTNLLRKRVVAPVAPAAAPEPQPQVVVPARADYAGLAGMSDEALKAQTGCTWERWVRALDRVKAHQWPHREIARYVREKYQTNSWWSQTVTVGYERIRGLRERGQRRSGHYEFTKSRTMPVPLGKLYRAFSQSRLRSQWLPEVTLTVRTATPNKYLRITWEDGSSVQVGFVSRARSKAQVAVQHEKLPSKEAADRMKRYWTERLEALATLLSG